MNRKSLYIWWGVLALLLVIAAWRFLLPNSSNMAFEKSESVREIIIYVAGAVEKPGLVHLPLEARLGDALELVNPLPEANIDLLNPAEKLKDGQKITVPYKPQSLPVDAANQGALVGAASGSTGIGSSGTAAAAAAASIASTSQTVSPSPTSNSGLININTAGASELDKLPGIGPALAERIIQYRNEHGAFLKPEDLQKVSGIGPKTYEKMASQVSVGP